MRSGAGKAWRDGLDVEMVSPKVVARRLRMLNPASSDNCWHATAFTSASNTVGNRGGFKPRSRAVIDPIRSSDSAIR